MNDSLISPGLKSARDYLEAARTRLPRDKPIHHAADYGLRLLTQVLDEVRDEVDGWEMAEVAAVYDTLTLLVAQALGVNANQSFRALAVLCEDEEALRLTRGQPEPPPALLQRLRSQLIWITVTYESAPNGKSQRIVDITHRNAAGDLRSAKSKIDFGYDDLPEPVRKRMLASGQSAVRYELFRASAPESRLASNGGS
jgi:hypothetical protein